MNLKSLSLVPKYKNSSSWWQHVPIAHGLIELCKPELVVELGSHYGVSFFSFCEAAEKYSPATFIYAIDNWQGDIQAGFYGDEVYNSVKSYAEENHNQRSALIRCLFDEAVSFFEDNSIDILHIDGLHTYEAVKNDWETWKTKLKENGTAIFHDWNVREEGFGVWKLWEEIKMSGEVHTIEVPNGYGLGIATFGTRTPEWHKIIQENLEVLKCKGLLLEQLYKLQEERETEKAKHKKVEEHVRNLEQMNADKESQIEQATLRMKKMERRYLLGILKYLAKKMITLSNYIKQRINR